MPFGNKCEFPNFDACVRKMKGKVDDAEGYCAQLMRDTEESCKAGMKKHGDHAYRETHGRYSRKLPTVVPAFISTRPSPGNPTKAVEVIIRDSADAPRYWKTEFEELLPNIIGHHAVESIRFQEAGDPNATAVLDLIIDGESRRLQRAATLAVTLLGVGNLGQSKYAPAGLLVRYKNLVLVFDGGEDNPAIPAEVDAWFVTDPQHEYFTEMQELAEGRGATLQTGWMAAFSRDELSVGAYGVPYIHDDTMAYNVTICVETQPGQPNKMLKVCWVPRASEVDSYVVQDSDLAFIGAAGWEYPLVAGGGKTLAPSALDVSMKARGAGVKQLVIVNYNDDVIRAVQNGQELPFGSIGEDGDIYAPKLTPQGPPTSNAYATDVAAKAATFGLHNFSKAADKQYTFGVMYQSSNDPKNPELDAHNEFVMADVMQEAQWDYVRQGDRRLYLQHGVAGIIPIGEWVDLVTWPFEVEAEFATPTMGKTTTRKSTIPANSVWMGVLWSDEGWKLVKAGKIRGFSMGGWAKRQPARGL